MYKPFLQGSSESGQAEPSLRFVRLPVHGWTAKISQANRETRLPPMRIILNIGGYSTVFIPGKSPGFLFKSAASSPKFLRLREKKVKLMSGFHSKGCFRGYIYVNDKVRLSACPRISGASQAAAYPGLLGCRCLRSASVAVEIYRARLAYQKNSLRRGGSSSELSCTYENICSRGSREECF